MMKHLITITAVLVSAVVCAAPAGPADNRELEGFVDGLMEAQRKAQHFAGAVVVVVRDGQIALAKGYGLPRRNVPAWNAL